jgi:hypothetical protein
MSNDAIPTGYSRWFSIKPRTVSIPLWRGFVNPYPSESVHQRLKSRANEVPAMDMPSNMPPKMSVCVNIQFPIAPAAYPTPAKVFPGRNFRPCSGPWLERAWDRAGTGPAQSQPMESDFESRNRRLTVGPGNDDKLIQRLHPKVRASTIPRIF